MKKSGFISKFILLSFFLSVVAIHVTAQKVTLSYKNVSFEKVLNSIKQQTGLSLVFSEQLVDVNRNVSVNVTSVEVQEVLKKMLAGTNVDFEIKNNKLYLIEKTTKEKPNYINANLKKITGLVTDSKSEPIIGATVIIKGLKTGTVTDINGQFSLETSTNSQIQISYIGYSTQTINVNDKSNYDIILIEDSKSLDEVVVVGYGVQRKRDVTTSISSLKASELAVPVTSVDQAMIGKLAGVQVIQPNGIPGGGMSIKVRGTGTISAGTDPLYVVDGFPMSDGSSNATGMKVNPLSSININDIESIEVLKDASATAIYGSRGSNGVVIITTKKGRESKPIVQYDGYYGWQQASKKIAMMNAYQQAQVSYEARNNAYLDALTTAGVTGSIDDTNDQRRTKLGQPLTNTKLNYLIPDLIKPYLNGVQGLTDTDWQDAVLRTASEQSHNVSVTGGSKAAQYFVSANYRKEDGIVLGTGFDQVGGRAKLDVTQNNFSFGANVSFNASNYDLVPTEDRYSNETILSTALGMLPSMSVYNTDGSYNFDQFTLNYGIPNLINPVALALERKDNMKRNRMLGNLYGEYQIIKDLKFETSFGVDYNSFRRNIFRPSTLPTTATLALPPSIPIGESRTKDVLDWVWENTLSYYKKINNDHTLTAVIGWTAQQESTDNSRITATGFPNDLVQTLNASTVATNWDTSREQWALLSGLARAQYNYKNKYLLSATIRSDGSSRFGQANRWGTFPSISGGWYVSEEDFMADQRHWLTSLKLRASHGLSGNFSIGNYGYYSTMSTDNYILGTTESIASGLYPQTAGNSELGWEKTAMTDIGLEIGLFNMFNLEIDVYNSITSDMLLNVPVPESSGYSTVLENIGKLRNRGFELSLSTTNTWNKFTWNNHLNFSLNRNVVLDLGGVSQMITKGETMEFITKIGEPIGNYYALVTDGVFLNQAEITNSKDPIIQNRKHAYVVGAEPGDFRFKDINGDGVIDSKDKTIVGNYAPDFTYGFSTDFKYKWFDLSLALQGVYGNKIANINRRYLDNMEGGSGQVDALNRWVSETNPGNGLVNRANRSSTGMNSQMSTWHIEDGSYLRIGNITFGVTLPQKLTKYAGISNARIYLSTQNPFTFTNYSGYNPEVDMKGSPLTPGIDYGTYPLAKSLVFGLNLTF